MNKGDDIQTEMAEVRLQLLSLEDVLVRYRSDSKPTSAITLRKDKQLVIKGMHQIRIQTDNPEKLNYKIRYKNRGSANYSELKETKFEFKAGGESRPLGEEPL